MIIRTYGKRTYFKITATPDTESWSDIDKAIYANLLDNEDDEDSSESYVDYILADNEE